MFGPMSHDHVTISVGGVPYTLALSDIRKYPNSFFECIVKKEWSEGAKSIDRDGYLFKSSAHSSYAVDCHEIRAD